MCLSYFDQIVGGFNPPLVTLVSVIGDHHPLKSTHVFLKPRPLQEKVENPIYGG